MRFKKKTDKRKERSGSVKRKKGRFGSERRFGSKDRLVRVKDSLPSDKAIGDI